MSHLAANLRRIMARSGLTAEEVVARSGLDDRTVRSILSGTSTKPHARTLHRLARGLGVSTDEFFQDPSLLAYRLFDRQTNPAVEEAVSSRPDLFVGWAEADFDELYSRFGVGGALTADGAIRAVEAMNHKREVYRKVALILESGEAELLSGFVDLVYQRIEADESDFQPP